jgi:hypothetical protein
MLSEQIDPLLFGDWPSRACELDRTGVRTLFVDHWAWGELTQDRADLLPAGHPSRGSFKRIRDAVRDGSVVIPLTIANYVENQTRTNSDARWDFAVTVGDLSGFNTFSAEGLARAEVLNAVATYHGIDSTVPDTFEPFGFGINHVLSGTTAPVVVVDSSTGHSVSSDPTIENRAELLIVERECQYIHERAMYALGDPRFAEIDPKGIAPAVEGMNAPFLAAQVELAEKFKSIDATPTQIRNSVHFLSVRDSSDLIEAAEAQLELPLCSTLAKIGDDMLGGDPDAGRRFLRLMPHQWIFSELRIQTFLKSSFRFQASDRWDFFSMATTIPFADVVVADRKTFNLLCDARIDSEFPTRLVRRIADAVEYLGI